MEQGKVLLIIDSIINLILGLVLIAYSEPVIKFFGLPFTEQYFYPNILGAILLGIALALFIEFKKKRKLSGLGLGGAICINLIGGIALLLWLVFGNLEIPVHGRIILWILDMILIGISSFEILVLFKKK